MFHLTYAHCIKAEPNKPDVAPYTRYEFRTVEAQMFRVHGSKMHGIKDTFDVDVDGRTISNGDTKEEARSLAAYTLMDESRTAAGFDFEPAQLTTKG